MATTVLELNSGAFDADISRSANPIADDTGDEEEIHKDIKIGPIHVWAIGIAIVLGHLNFHWNFAYSAGFASCFLSFALVGLAYICLCLCNAEMSSMLPFAGGAYGLARVTLGLYVGFLVGCCESVEYLAYAAISSTFLGGIITDFLAVERKLIPLFCLLFYSVTVGVSIIGGRTMWTISLTLGCLSFFILFIFCFGVTPWVDKIEEHSSNVRYITGEDSGLWFVGGMGNFINIMPLTAWVFVGIEALNLCNSVVPEV